VVVGFRRSAAVAERLAATLAGSGHSAHRAPVTDSAALQTLAAAIMERYGRCDVLVNCAGTTRFVVHADLNGLDDALIDEILTTNVRGSFATVRALNPLLKASTRPGGGVVINISSIAARTAMGSNIMYCASKAALDNMTQSLARALAPAVRVISVSPGLVDTEFVKSLDPEWRDQQAARTPLGRLAAPDEVAAAVLVAVRDLSFTTGCVLSVDGGRPLN
jgi:3-oxoacyl-[acyl-carrier protein] reductase